MHLWAYPYTPAPRLHQRRISSNNRRISRAHRAKNVTHRHQLRYTRQKHK
jgi:hypothetical protein